MKQRIVFLIVFAIAFFMPVKCFSGDILGMHEYDSQNADEIRLFIGEKTWQSTGDNKWNIAGTKSGGPPNVLSELEYLRLQSVIYEIYGGIRNGRAALTIASGFGSMYGGIYRDSDYLRDNRQGIFSLSTGKADGSEWNALYYWNIDYSYRVLVNEQEQRFNKMYLDVLAGYQVWHEKITMTNGVQEIGGVLGPFSGLNSKYDFLWKSIRVGLGGGLPIHERFAFKGSAIFIPYTEYEGKGIWNLRTDFKQSPSFVHQAKGGYGAQIEASVVYYAYSTFTMGVGYRYWYIKSGKGDDITYFSNGAVGVTQFNEAVNQRQGFFIDFNYTF